MECYQIRIFIVIVLAATCSGQGNLPEDALTCIRPSNIAAINAINTNAANMLVLGGTVLVDSTLVTAVQGIDRKTTSVTLSTSTGSFKDLMFAVDASSSMILHLAHLANEDRIHDSARIVIEAAGTSSSAISQISPVVGNSGNCLFKAFSTQYSPSSSKTIETVLFAVYMDDSTVSNANVVFETKQSTKLQSIVKVEGSPDNVVLGALIFSKTAGSDALQPTDAKNMVEILTPCICAELRSLPNVACINGVSGTDQNGDPTCNCNPNYFGAICNRMCINGQVVTLPPHNVIICQCNFGWGGDACDIESPAAKFLSLMHIKAPECENLLANHAPYTYLDPDTNTNIIDPVFDGKIFANTRPTQFGTSISSLQSLTFGATYSSPYFAMSDATHDLLFVTYIPASNPLDGSYIIQLQNTLAFQSNIVKISSSNGVEGRCVYQYDIVQSYATSLSEAVAAIFFVSGVQSISIMPTSTDIQSSKAGGVQTDVWTANGAGMSDIMMGYTLIGREVAGELPESELGAVARCYAEQACGCLLINCYSGVQQFSAPQPTCQCNEGFVGLQCRFPLC